MGVEPRRLQLFPHVPLPSECWGLDNHGALIPSLQAANLTRPLHSCLNLFIHSFKTLSNIMHTVLYSLDVMSWRVIFEPHCTNHSIPMFELFWVHLWWKRHYGWNIVELDKPHFNALYSLFC